MPKGDHDGQPDTLTIMRKWKKSGGAECHRMK
jgi:hypothetical protein